MSCTQVARSLVCDVCLKSFSQNLHLGEKWCHNTLAEHKRKCALPYTNLVFRDDNLEIFCISLETSDRDKRFAFNSVVMTMHESDEILADKIGWNPTSRRKHQDLTKHMFIPVLDGLTAGVAIVTQCECQCMDITTRAD